MPQYYGDSGRTAAKAVAITGASYECRCICGTPACMREAHALKNRVLAAEAWFKKEGKRG